MLSVISLPGIISFLFLVLSIVLLSIGVGKHFKDCFKKPITQSQQRVARGGGWLTLLFSLGLVEPLPINYVVWTTQLSLIILIQGFILSRFQTVRKQPYRRR